MIPQWLKRRVLENFLYWIEEVDGPGSFTEVIEVKVERYLAQ